MLGRGAASFDAQDQSARRSARPCLALNSTGQHYWAALPARSNSRLDYQQVVNQTELLDAFMAKHNSDLMAAGGDRL